MNIDKYMIFTDKHKWTMPNLLMEAEIIFKWSLESSILVIRTTYPNMQLITYLHLYTAPGFFSLQCHFAHLCLYVAACDNFLKKQIYYFSWQYCNDSKNYYPTIKWHGTNVTDSMANSLSPTQISDQLTPDSELKQYIPELY